MELTFVHKNLSKTEAKEFVDYLAKKIAPIENLLTKFASDASLLKVAIKKFEKHTAYQVEFCLSLPMKSLVSTEASHKISKAIDLCKDRLLAQIKKQMALLRNERSHRSIRDQKLNVFNYLDVTEEVV